MEVERNSEAKGITRLVKKKNQIFGHSDAVLHLPDGHVTSFRLSPLKYYLHANSIMFHSSPYPKGLKKILAAMFSPT